MVKTGFSSIRATTVGDTTPARCPIRDHRAAQSAVGDVLSIAGRAITGSTPGGGPIASDDYEDTGRAVVIVRPYGPRARVHRASNDRLESNV
ncbi:hypothetical protein [Streptomyces sp. NPDC093060]|uniref:hypothetical protein n=1 Tax=Streptomyces sp. NPDC093060 TaxID=3366019 RepID=UPI0037F6E333